MWRHVGRLVEKGQRLKVLARSRVDLGDAAISSLWERTASWTLESVRAFLRFNTVDAKGHRVPKLGSCWGGFDCANPSYYAPAHYRAFRDFSAATRRLVAASCAACAPGRRHAGMSCVACRVGTYQPREAQTSCAACPEGRMTGGNGSVACFAVPAGAFVGGRDGAQEEQCPPGHEHQLQLH